LRGERWNRFDWEGAGDGVGDGKVSEMWSVGENEVESTWKDASGVQTERGEYLAGFGSWKICLEATGGKIRSVLDGETV